jgi:hypothetical protein
MSNRFFALSAIAVLMFGVFGFAVSDISSAQANKAQTTRLVGLLPASDGVAVFDSKRFLNDALPKVLSANQPMLAEVMAKITEMESRTGIDLRKFDQVAVGVGIKQSAGKGMVFEPVAIANGDINAGALVAVAKLASNGTYHEEKIGEKSVYVFSTKDALKKAPVKVTNSKIAQIIDHGVNSLTHEVAVATLDTNTLVLGSLARVRETLEGKSRVAADVVGLLSVKDTAVMSFSFKTVGGLAKLLPLDNDELGKNFDAIQYLLGSLDVAAVGTSLHVSARTSNPAQAQGLKDMLDGLAGFGKAILGNSKRTDQLVYGRMLKAARFDVRGSDMTLDLLVPQSDLDILIGGLK